MPPSRPRAWLPGWEGSRRHRGGIELTGAGTPSHRENTWRPVPGTQQLAFSISNLLNKDRMGRCAGPECAAHSAAEVTETGVFVSLFSQVAVYLGFNPNRLQTRTNTL